MLTSSSSALIAGEAFAQTALTWSQCAAQALDQNPELRTAMANVRSSQFQQNVARSDYFPQVSAKISASRSNSGSSSFGSNSIGSGSTTGPTTLSATTTTSSNGGPQDTASQTLSLTQNIFSGFQTDSKVKQAKANADSALAAFNLKSAQVNLDLKSAFADLQFAQNNVKLTQDITRRREENYKIVALRYQSGNENKGSLLLSKASLNQAKFEQLQAKNSIGVSSTQLAKVLGREDGPVLTVLGDVPKEPIQQNIDFVHLVLAVPESQQALAQYRSAKSGVDLAMSAYYPSLNLSSDAGRQEIVDGNDRNRWDVGLTLSVPLFSGGKDYYGVKSAKAQSIAASSNIDTVEKQVLFKLKQSFTGYVEAVEKVSVDKSFVEAALTRSEIARSKYDNGLLSFEDWDIIENDLISRQKAFIQSERDRIKAQASWEQAQGKGVKV